MTLRGGTVALYPYHGHLPDLLENDVKRRQHRTLSLGHLPGFQKTHNNVCTVSKRSSLTGNHLASILYNKSKLTLEAFWQQFQIYTPPSLRIIRVTDARAKGQSDIRTIYSDSQLNRPESVSLANYILHSTLNLTDFLKL